MQLLILLGFLDLCLFVFSEGWTACVFDELSPFPARHSLFVSLSFQCSWLLFFVLCVESIFVVIAFQLSLIRSSVLIGLPVFVVIWGVVLTIV